MPSLAQAEAALADDRALVGRDARRRAGPHARRFVRSHRQSLAAVPDAELPHLGAQRSVSAGRRLRLPRSAAGRAGAALHAAGPVPRASAARRVAAVRRGRRAALVASAERTRHANALLGRPALAAVRRRRATSSQTGDESVLDEVVPFLEAPPLEPDQHETYILPPVSPETASLFEHCVRAIDARDEVRRARAAAHRLRRLERRHEPRRPRRPRRERVARLVPRHRAERLRADLRAPRARRSRAAATATRRAG